MVLLHLTTGLCTGEGQYYHILVSHQTELYRLSYLTISKLFRCVFVRVCAHVCVFEREKKKKQQSVVTVTKLPTPGMFFCQHE